MRRYTVKRAGAKRCAMQKVSRSRHTIKKALSIVMLVYMLAMLVMPFQSFAAGRDSPPEKPYEKMIAKKGNWYSSQLSYEGEKSLVVGYRGSFEFEKDSTAMYFTFDVKETTVLTGIYIPFKGLLGEGVRMALVSEQGNFYQGFEGTIEYVGTAKEAADFSQAPSGNEGQGGDQYPDGDDNTMDYTERLDSSGGNTIIYYQPEDAIVLPKGRYMIQLDGGAWPADGYFVKGMDYKAYEKYKAALMKWAGDEEREILGNAELGEDFWEKMINEIAQEPLWMAEGIAYKTPVFRLDDSYVLDEIILSTWNDGAGASPGLVYLYDEAKTLIDTYQSQGYSRGEDANTFWVVLPDLLLPAGTYYIDIDDEWALDFDEDGEPLFAVSVSPAPELPASFTGTYRINLDLYKTRTLMGDVDPPEKAFDLRQHEIAVIDKGEFIEIIGKYEGMPFSQNCPVIERGIDYALVSFNFAADLTGLPYKAKISANGTVHFEKAENGTLYVSAEGFGYYDRAASKEKGADSNTYTLTAGGNKVKEGLPPFVMAAIGAAYGAGNIPGPDSPIEAAAGILFPPLVGLIVSSLQTALKPKEPISKPKTKLSVGEQAMKEANHSMAGKLISEREAEAWKIMADALGASGGDPDDPVSMGDNEIRDAKAAAAAGPSSGGVFGGYDGEPGYDSGYEPEGDGDYAAGYEPEGEGGYGHGSDGHGDGGGEAGGARAGKAAGPADDMAAASREGTPSGRPQIPEGPDEIELVTDHKGNKTTYVRDPETGDYVNPYTGGVLDPELYRKVVVPGMEGDKDFIEKEWEKNVKGQTLQDYLVWENEIKIKEKQEQLDLLIKLNKKYGVSTLKEAEDIIRKQNQEALEFAEKWQNIAVWAGRIEKASTVVVSVCDASLDALSKVTGPAGKGINSGYKLAKNVAGEMAVDGGSVKSFGRGLAKGAGDATRVWIKGPAGKYISVVAGETVAGYIDNGAAGATRGFYEGMNKGALLAVSDKLAGTGPGKSMPTFPLMEGEAGKLIWGAKEPIGRVFTAKLGKNLTDNFGIKPYITKPIGKKIEGAVATFIR